MDTGQDSIMLSFQHEEWSGTPDSPRQLQAKLSHHVLAAQIHRAYILCFSFADSQASGGFSRAADACSHALELLKMC